jgi:hypothetical protein
MLAHVMNAPVCFRHFHRFYWLGSTNYWLGPEIFFYLTCGPAWQMISMIRYKITDWSRLFVSSLPDVRGYFGGLIIQVGMTVQPPDSNKIIWKRATFQLSQETHVSLSIPAQTLSSFGDRTHPRHAKLGIVGAGNLTNCLLSHSKILA